MVSVPSMVITWLIPISPDNPLGPCGPGGPILPSTPGLPLGILKFNTTSLLVPTFVTKDSVSGSPVSVIPTSIVVGPFSPLGPVGPVAPVDPVGPISPVSP